MPRELEGWRSSGRRDDDGAIASEQRVWAPAPAVEASERGARLLGARYWQQIPRSTARLVGSRENEAGVELRLLGRGPVLLHLGPAEVAVASERVACRYPIAGGWLVRRAGGAIELTQTGEAPYELAVAVSGYFPRLTGRAYERVQRPVHVALARRYLGRLVAEAAR